MILSLAPRLRVVALALGFISALETSLHAEDWPQWLGVQRDGVWRETGIFETLPTNGFTYRWRTPIGGGYSGPTVIFVRKRDDGSCAEWLSLSV